MAISPATRELFFEQPRDHDANSGSFNALIVTTLPYLVFSAGSGVFFEDFRGLPVFLTAAREPPLVAAANWV